MFHTYISTVLWFYYVWIVTELTLFQSLYQLNSINAYAKQYSIYFFCVYIHCFQYLWSTSLHALLFIGDLVLLPHSFLISIKDSCFYFYMIAILRKLSYYFDESFRSREKVFYYRLWEYLLCE